MNDVRLTQFSPGAGCGCKISSKILENLLKDLKIASHDNLIVGNDSDDDAAVFDLGNGKALISTTDFFTPIVDDAYDFGRISAANAISDVFSMGGRPILSLAILGWPLDIVPAEIAKKVIEGAIHVCNEVNISLAGGHSININVPVFGLCVNGLIDIKNIKRNNSASKDDVIFLTKPLGTGIIATAQKKSLLDNVHLDIAVNIMTSVNRAGESYAQLQYVKAMTDVTGFGLSGHLFEMINNTELDAVIDFNTLPLIDGLDKYIRLNCIPGGTMRNIENYQEHLGTIDEYRRIILCDPQTSGGLLVAVKYDRLNEFYDLSEKIKQPVYRIGYFTSQSDPKNNLIHIN